VKPNTAFRRDTADAALFSRERLEDMKRAGSEDARNDVKTCAPI